MTTLELQKPILEHWLTTGQGISARDLAVATNHSESAVRRNLDQGVDGITSDHEARESYSRKDPAIIVGVHQVRLYRPTMGLLRALLRQAMGLD